MTLENAQIEQVEATETTPENTRGRQRTPLPAEFEELMGRYGAYLELALPGQTARTYSSAVRVYLAWLADGEHDGKPLEDKAARNWAVRDYRSYLATTLKRAPATINKALSALDDFYTFLGLGPAEGSNGKRVKRHDVPQGPVRALSPKAKLRYVRAVEACESARDRLMALLPLYAGLRVSEVAGLDVADITTSARKGSIRVVGKGSKPRDVPANQKLREALAAWKAERPATGTKALFVTRLGTRPTPEAVDDAIASITKAAGLDDHVTAHVLRHTYGTDLVRNGQDLVQVAALMGHARVETTRRYAKPTEDDLAAAVERLIVDD
jgi:integrase/recombinase XerC